ncbi:tRNA uridine-5-carboxymethylaminomethyl(34) synthesis GTPase MnmE [Turneriella parva]|uniref:tRNA modification GTPase MnmE n=1 Tax=Turneriella parva (strain ATCC BAA-1111 / DSM 21527 / NCTC 11395 / H) TaxID=869212 RepID=I4BAW1_TURPD|nr:tRNA uridine-5-carboxymethylaminomethyl(34) synthesis GTPase MnmE [Turneriella parva]AFM14418.1 tRNA modification GTPase trmE [Turneriella parva DSM 21527]
MTQKAPTILSSKATTSTADFICAPATVAGARSAIAVIRGSGAPGTRGSVFTALANIFLTPAGKCAAELTARVAHYGNISDGDEFIDDVLFFRFDGPASFTGEDSFEIHCHGNPLIVRAILTLLYRHGFRSAEPGEFTRRAYLNGKLGLNAAQAVAEVIEARSQLSLKAAHRLSRGTFRSGLLSLRSSLMNLAADLNAELDFIDEDIAFATLDTKLAILSRVEGETQKLADDAQRFDSIRGGVNIAIVGAPNAGKSSLLNRLLGHERSIVSDIAGTTRDYIEAELEIQGVNVRLFDTAGLREDSGDTIEIIGIERTRELIGRAHICLLIADGSIAPTELETLLPAETPARLLVAVNKCDMLHAEWANRRKDSPDNNSVIYISALTGEGFPALMQAFAAITAELAPQDAVPLSVWQVKLLNEIASLMRSASNLLRDRELPELIAHQVTRAIDCMSELTGEISSEDILGRIFSRFCIGK